MRTRNGAWLVAVVAGAACSVAGAAPADQNGRTPLQYGGKVRPTHIIYQGQVYPVRPAAPADGPQIVYDNGVTIDPVPGTTTGAFTTSSEPNDNLMDEISFSPGPGAGSGVLITSTVVNLGIQGPGTPPVPTLPNDAIALQYRIWDTITPTVSPVHSDLRGDVTFIFDAPVGGWMGGFYYESDPIDLTMLPGGGIQTSDDTIGVNFSYFTTMIDPITQLPVATTTPHPDASVAFADFSGPITLSVGNSDLTYWRDANANGQIDMDEQRQFAAPAVANFILQITGTVGGGGGGCYANCDGSTNTPILNVNDFICFQSAFAAGDSYANCDGSTNVPVLNVNDFICFQTAFAAGCSAP